MSQNRRSVCSLAALSTLSARPGAALAQTAGNSSPLKLALVSRTDRGARDCPSAEPVGKALTAIAADTVAK